MSQRKPKLKGDARMVTGVCRLSFPSLFETALDQDNQDTGKYATVLLFSKDDTEMVSAVEKCIAEAKARGIKDIKEWRGKFPVGAHSPLQDGDERTTPLDGYEGSYYIRVKSNRRPKVLDRHVQPIAPDYPELDELVYPGANAVASIEFYPFYAKGKSGIAASFSAVQVLPGGERFGGGGFSPDDFSAEEDSEDDL